MSGKGAEKAIVLNDLEQATQTVWEDWEKADEIAQKRAKAKQAAASDLPLECKAAQYYVSNKPKSQDSTHPQSVTTSSWSGFSRKTRSP